MFHQKNKNKRTNEDKLTMTTSSPLTWSLLILALMHVVLTLTPYPRCHGRSLNSRLFGSNNDEDELERKMALVRALQSAYYQSDTSTAPTLDTASGILRNLPLWRVQWTELPGRSNVLNVHEGIYTNMFETCLRREKPFYVGHVHLPGGSKNIKSEQRCYELKTWREEVKDKHRGDSERSAVVGTLLRITDFRRLSDGRLILLVQALERFVVVNCVQELPYSIADVQILPDFDNPIPKEVEARMWRTSAVLESFRYQNYEYDVDFSLPLADGKYLSVMDIWGPDIAKLLPFVPYSTTIDPSKLDSAEAIEQVGQPVPANEWSLESQLLEGGVLRSPPSLLSLTRTELSADDLEDMLWTALVDFSRATKIVLPKEVLCLLPPNRDWPTPVERLSPEYPSHRRQRRLSFCASALLENTNIGADLRQVWLETPGTKARLRSEMCASHCLPLPTFANGHFSLCITALF